MAVVTLWLFKCGINRGSSAVSGEQPNIAVDLQLQRFSRKQTLEQTTFADQPVQVANEVVPLPVHEFKADLTKYRTHLEQLVSRKGISTAVIKMMVEEILQYVSEHVAGREKEKSLHVVMEVDGVVELNWTATEIAKEEEGDRDRDEKSETCSICLDELNGRKRAEIVVPCGHVYHDLCIFNWLVDRSTCPLCRAPLYFRD